MVRRIRNQRLGNGITVYGIRIRDLMIRIEGKATWIRIKLFETTDQNIEILGSGISISGS